MRIRFLLTLILAVCLAAGPVEAQMMFTPGADYLTVKGKKKKDKKPASKTDKKKKSVSETEIRAGLGLYTAFPVSDFNRDVYTGFGVHLDGEYFLDPQISVGLNTGYQSFKFDEIHIGQGHYSMIPILVKGSYYFKDGDFHPFAGLNAGIFLTRSKYDSIIEPRNYLDPVTQLFIHTPGGVKPIDEKETAFGIAPMAGIVYTPTEGIWINCNVRYNMVFTKERTNPQIGLHIGVTYSFGI